jgi:hypothetical protein
MCRKRAFREIVEMAGPWKAWESRPSGSTAARKTLAEPSPLHIFHDAKLRAGM